MVDMTTKDTIYDRPNVGCLLGTAYNLQEARLRSALSTSGLDITPAEYVVLKTLFDRGELQQCEVSRLIGKDKASVSRTVSSLVRKGLVTSNQISYKCSMVSLTSRAESLRGLLFEIASRCHRELEDKISKPQVEILRKILEKMIK